jgi:hypothetical protein
MRRFPPDRANRSARPAGDLLDVVGIVEDRPEDEPHDGFLPRDRRTIFVQALDDRGSAP